MNPLITYLLATPREAEAKDPLSGTFLAQPVEADKVVLSAASEQILRRGNWDYMWRKARDLGAQGHPEFTPDEDPDIEVDQTYR